MNKPENYETRGPLISLQKAAEMIGGCTRTVRREIQRGKLPPIIKWLNRSRLPLHAVEAYIANLPVKSN